MKLIHATFQADNEVAEGRIWAILEGLNAKTIKTLPNTDHLKENKSFKALLKAKKDAESNLYDFINKNR